MGNLQETHIINGTVTDFQLDHSQINILLMDGKDLTICIYTPVNSGLLTGITSLLGVISKVQCHGSFKYVNTLDDCQRLKLSFYNINDTSLGCEVELFKNSESQNDMITYSGFSNNSITSVCTLELLSQIKHHLDAFIN